MFTKKTLPGNSKACENTVKQLSSPRPFELENEAEEAADHVERTVGGNSNHERPVNQVSGVPLPT